jgi:hypothetical protein
MHHPLRPCSATLAAGLLAVGVLAADVPAPGAPPAPPSIPRSLDVPGGSLVAAGPAPELDLLYTGDVVGYIEPCG